MKREKARDKDLELDMPKIKRRGAFDLDKGDGERKVGFFRIFL